MASRLAGWPGGRGAAALAAGGADSRPRNKNKGGQPVGP